MAQRLNLPPRFDSYSLDRGGDMIRLLTIDGDRKRAQALALECLEQGVALRMAEGDQARLFEAVAPGVPVILTVDAGAKVEDLVDLELQGFRVMSRPFALRDLLAKVEVPAKVVL